MLAVLVLAAAGAVQARVEPIFSGDDVTFPRCTTVAECNDAIETLADTKTGSVTEPVSTITGEAVQTIDEAIGDQNLPAGDAQNEYKLRADTSIVANLVMRKLIGSVKVLRNIIANELPAGRRAFLIKMIAAPDYVLAVLADTPEQAYAGASRATGKTPPATVGAAELEAKDKVEKAFVDEGESAELGNQVFDSFMFEVNQLTPSQQPRALKALSFVLDFVYN